VRPVRAIPTRPQAPTYTRQPLDCIFGEPKMTHDQIAAVLGISRQGVQATFTRVNKRLRRALADLNPYLPEREPKRTLIGDKA